MSQYRFQLIFRFLYNFKRSNFYQPRVFKSKDIATLGIVAYGRDYEADIDLAKIEFY